MPATRSRYAANTGSSAARSSGDVVERRAFLRCLAATGPIQASTGRTFATRLASAAVKTLLLAAATAAGYGERHDRAITLRVSR